MVTNKINTGLFQVLPMAAGLDLQTQRMAMQLIQTKKVNQILHNLTDQCWETCVGTPGSQLDGRTERCITNCVNRFIDTSNFVSNRLAEESKNAKQGGGEFDLE